MPCDNEAQLLNAYLEADQRYKDVTLQVHAVVPGEPLKRERLDEARIELITQRERERDEAERAWHEHLVPQRQ